MPPRRPGVICAASARLAALLLLACSVSLTSLLSACATLPDGSGIQSEPPQPVITARGVLGKRQAEAVIQAAAGASTAQQRAAVIQLTDAVRAATAAPLVLGNRVTPLVDGPDTFASLRRHISEARSSIHVETYIFADDQLGREFADLLIGKARQSVSVRVIVDALGSMKTARELFEHMRNGGVQVLQFRPLAVLRTLPWRHHNRDHRKLLIVDGKVAYTGGLNISGTYSSASILRPGPERGLEEGWRDTHVMIEGPAVRQFQAIFLETWVRLGGEIEKSGELDADTARYYPPLQAEGNAIVAAVVSSGARERDEAIYFTHLAAIRNATQRIWITQAYFAPPPELRMALIEAARRGVDVRVLVPGFTDSSPIFYASRATYAELLEGGVRLFEVKDALLHAKTAVFDDALSMIGSANLDYRSFLHNNEVTAVIVSEALAQRMQQIFQRDESAAVEITREQWQQRSGGQRFKEWLSQMFDYWL